MTDLSDGETTTMQGSGAKPYIIKNVGGVYSCSCPAWRNQSLPIESRTCKHLRKLRGDAAENLRVGSQTNVSQDKQTAEKKQSNAPALLLAESWDGESDPTGWLMSEKLDGVRAYWNGKMFISRNGNQYFAPEWFTHDIPNIPLDGELWLDRKQFQQTMSIVRRKDARGAWDKITYQVYDHPEHPGEFEERYKEIKKLFGNWANIAKPLEQIVCKGRDHLQTTLDDVIARGGEGLMLRQPGSKYVAGRSATLLKVKVFYDAEAVVTGYEKGKGRHKGRMGAVTVKLPNGIQFSVGSGFTDNQRENPPPIGSTITFKYQELTDAGVPRFPTFVRMCL